VEKKREALFKPIPMADQSHLMNRMIKMEKKNIMPNPKSLDKKMNLSFVFKCFQFSSRLEINFQGYAPSL